MKRTVALIQARMSSSRFPGKVLHDLDGVPMIVYIARRARRAATLDAVVVVTSTDPSDDALCASLRDHDVDCLRGDLDDVLARYQSGASHSDAAVIVRLTGDCPLVDPTLVDHVVRRLQETGADYASNVDPATFPDGFDVECFTRATLERACREARTGPEREHVTLWMRSAAAGLSRTNIRAPADLSNLRLTVDYPDDLDVVRQVVACTAGRQADFDLFDVLRILHEHPDLAAHRHVRNEGLTKSVAQWQTSELLNSPGAD